jgi:proteasome lid subunit RPN8/RPN11
MDEISFGDVQEAERQRQRRPDENKHFAVTPVFEPDEGDLRVYVDIDALRDMEAHALSNTTVELGGVLLGGQFEDEDGRPFVVVTDSLRAQHYESTKGSFKFTHDTWSQITRERDEFPEELQMVGWYHTHPDWGVFLSGMDMFICDNFFNKPLDVALVIDPCRDDRGFFQWTGNPSQRVRRTGGFYLVGSRFRAAELEFFAAQLEGKAAMAPDPRFSGYPGVSPAPVINIADKSGAWQAPAIMGMLTIQFCILALLAWRLLAPLSDEETLAARDKKLDAIEQRLEDLAAIRSEQARLDAQREVLDRVVANLPGGPQGLVTALDNERQRAELLEAAATGQSAVAREKEAELRRERTLRKQEAEGLKRNLAKVQDANKDLALRNKALGTDLASYKERLKQYEPEADETDEKVAEGAENSHWKTYAMYGAVVVVFLAVLGTMAFLFRRGAEEEMFSEGPPDKPQEDLPE